MDGSSTSDAFVRIASVVTETDAEGPGRRFAVWTQGCTIRCDGCFNPQMWTGNGGQMVAVDILVEQIRAADVEGLTILGGEPFEQALPLSGLASAVQRLGLSVMTFTGHDYEHLKGPNAPLGAYGLLAHTDLLVDGRYVATQPDLVRPWVGSTNQRFRFLSSRYEHLADTLDDIPDRVEVRVGSDGEVSVNGWASVAQLDELLAGISAPLGRGKIR
ncbi:4Fe-4S single cluster domain-containing protein [Nocardioides anomalus]|uniref:4Fe-4S single cluster domain-containing protein n=1 Tax=Nocardioides anomalus TaxID=2712223 RepID=UPI0038B26E81